MQAARAAAKASYNKLLNYQPRRIRLKNQLTGTDTTAYALWKWVVGEKLRVDLIMYSTQKNCVGYTFSQLTQPIFQQLDA